MSSKLRTLDYSAARPSRDTWISQGLTPPWVWLYEHSFLNLAGRTFTKDEIENDGTKQVRAGSCRPGSDDGGGGRQERDGEADGAIGADGQKVFEDD